eukprot:SAG22_NODE_299_length_12768_cov_11.369426_4_plen_169_part_00
MGAASLPLTKSCCLSVCRSVCMSVCRIPTHIWNGIRYWEGHLLQDKSRAGAFPSNYVEKVTAKNVGTAIVSVKERQAAAAAGSTAAASAKGNSAAADIHKEIVQTRDARNQHEADHRAEIDRHEAMDAELAEVHQALASHAMGCVAAPKPKRGLLSSIFGGAAESRRS